MPLKQKHIVAIDDTPAIRTFLRILLQAHGATIHEAGTAQEGLELCRSVKPALVVLDLGLPDKDGLDILSEIKSIEHEGKEPAVIILSVRKELRTKSKAFELGADAYLTKPFLMEELVEVIEEKLGRKLPVNGSGG